MAIRIPLDVVAQFTETNELGAGSVSGGIAHPFQVNQDTDNIVVKFTASIAGAGASVILQTSDDGGTTYFDVARSSIVSNAVNATAQWISAPTIGYGIRPNPSVVATGSVVAGGGTIGSAAASTLAQGQVSGMPIMGIQNRVFIVLTGNVTSAASNTIVTTVSTNNQSVSHP